MELVLGNEEELAAEIAAGRTAIIVGAGVPIAATGAKVASWKGFLEDGLRRCHLLLSHELRPGWLEEKLRALEHADGDELLNLGSEVTHRLKKIRVGEFGAWLAETVGTLRAKSDDTLVGAVRSVGATILTTNYDHLLATPESRPLTWQDEARVVKVIRGEMKGVIHLHGEWEHPESIVLGRESYEHLAGNKLAHTLETHLLASKTLILIGCGDGLQDPNFACLLQWMAGVLKDTHHHHFRLAKADEVSSLQAKHGRDGIRVLSYGAEYGDLAKFLRRLSSRTLVLDGAHTRRVLKFANPTILLETDPLAAAPPAFLRGAEGTLASLVTHDGVWLKIKKERCIVGRDADRVDLRLVGDSGISKAHCEIALMGAHWQIVDLGSTNGTTLNGRRIDAGHPAVLNSGDELVLGRLTAWFSLGKTEEVAALVAKMNERETLLGRPGFVRRAATMVESHERMAIYAVCIDQLDYDFNPANPDIRTILGGVADALTEPGGEPSQTIKPTSGSTTKRIVGRLGRATFAVATTMDDDVTPARMRLDLFDSLGVTLSVGIAQAPNKSDASTAVATLALAESRSRQATARGGACVVSSNDTKSLLELSPRFSSVYECALRNDNSVRVRLADLFLNHADIAEYLRRSTSAPERQSTSAICCIALAGARWVSETLGMEYVSRITAEIRADLPPPGRSASTLEYLVASEPPLVFVAIFSQTALQPISTEDIEHIVSSTQFSFKRRRSPIGEFPGLDRTLVSSWLLGEELTHLTAEEARRKLVAQLGPEWPALCEAPVHDVFSESELEI